MPSPPSAPASEEEHLEPRTGYSLDLALPSSRVAVEVDGPSDFLLPDGQGVRRPNGPTLLKRRLLMAPPRGGWLEGDQRSIRNGEPLRDGQ